MITGDEVANALRKKQSENLAKARVARIQRGRLRKAMRAGLLDPFAVIEGRADPENLIESVVARVRIIDLLPMIRGVARSRAAEIVDALDVDPRTRMYQLTAMQRHELMLLCKGAIDPGFIPPLRPDVIPDRDEDQ